MRHLLSLTILAIIHFSALSLWANSTIQLPEPTFGAEFTFSNQQLATQDYGPNRVKVAEMKELMTSRCQTRGNCVVKEDLDGYRVEYTDHDFWFRVNVDNRVVETQTRPSTMNEFVEIRDLLQSDLFDLAAQVGIHPQERLGGGHIHQGAQSSFGIGTAHEDALLFRNYLVDLVAHPEVGQLWANDTYNSPQIAEIDQIAEFKKVIQEFDAGQIRGIQDLAKAIELRVYTKNPWAESLNWAPLNKYQAKNLARLSNLKKKWDVEAKTLEHRDVGPQRSVDEFIAQISLLRARTHYLAKLNAPLPLYIIDSARAKSQANWNQKIDYFKAYIQESNLPWDLYFDWIRPNYKSGYNQKSFMKLSIESLKKVYQKILGDNPVAPQCTQVF